MSIARLLLLCLCLGGFARGAVAATVYKCSDAQGRVVYQDLPCARTQTQQLLQLRDRAPAMPASIARAPSPATLAEPAAPPIAPLPRPAPPTLYGCVRATDGKAYLSAGQTSPYMAPLGMLGVLPSSLSQTYGARGRGGMSAPAANRGATGSNLAAGSYTWVQDACRMLSPVEACQALRDQNDANDEKLRRAFKSDQPPLEQRQEQLRQQLAGC